ncbi:MAG: hypothetical protein JW875_01090 [Spirochaetales bacterium]|nr:hypothetical protein [Spirochaetales bacterium]
MPKFSRLKNIFHECSTLWDLIVNKKFHIILLLAAFLALFIGSFDYVYGHVHENPVNMHLCPMCSAYQTLIIVFSLNVFLLFLRILNIAGTISPEEFSYSSAIFDTSCLPRSPPYPA